MARGPDRWGDGEEPITSNAVVARVGAGRVIDAVALASEPGDKSSWLQDVVADHARLVRERDRLASELAPLRELAEAAREVLVADEMIADYPSHSATRRWDHALEALRSALEAVERARTALGRDEETT
jgi:hypothetical protein